MSMQFEDYLTIFAKTTSQNVTHTRLGNKDLGARGGVYHVPLEKRDAFYNAYYDAVFAPYCTQTLNTVEHLTEYPLPKDYTNSAGEKAAGPILSDIDLYYDANICTRLHTKDHIAAIIHNYTEELKKYYQFCTDDQFNIFVLEKDTVTHTPNATKDGIHIIIGIQCEPIIQELLQKSIMPSLSRDVLHSLPLKNGYDNIIDHSITKGSTPWQLFGSRKPGHEPYRLTAVYTVRCHTSYGQWQFDITCEPFTPTSFISRDLFMRLSARYDAHPRFPLTAEAQQLVKHG